MEDINRRFAQQKGMCLRISPAYADALVKFRDIFRTGCIALLHITVFDF